MEEDKIKAIRKYLSHNGVKYYDVQAELIDHFATAVEKIERENPGINFKDALHKAHRSFGGSEGFRKYIEEAKKNVQHKTWKLVAQTLLQFIKWPYLVITAAVALCWHFILAQWQPNSSMVLLSFTTAYVAVMSINYFRVRKLEMYLPREANTRLGWIFYWGIYIPGYVTFFPDGESGYYYGLVYFTLLTLNLFAFYRVPTLAIRETKKLYPNIAR